MTNSLGVGKSWPGDPTLPSQAPQGYVTPQAPERTPQSPFSSEEIEAFRGDFIEMLLRTIVEATIGIFFPGAGDAFDQLADFFDELPGIGELVQAITGILGGDLGALGDFFTDLFDVLSGGAGSGFFSVLDPIFDFIAEIPIIGQLVSTITGVLGGDMTDLGDFFDDLLDILGGGNGSGAFSSLNGILGFFTDFIDVLTGGIGGAFLTGNIADAVVGGIGNILDNIFGAITGLLGIGGRSHTDMTEAVSEQAEAVATNSAQLTQVLAALGPGTPDADDFERTASTLGANWTTYTSGSGGTLGTPNGHDASWGGSGDMEWVAKKTNKVALGDNQVVSMVFASSPQSATVLLPTEFAKNDLWARMSTFSTYATRTGVRARYDVSGKTLKLSSFNNGTETTMTTRTGVSVPVSGTTMSLECGVGGNPRRFVIKLNGVSMIDWVEVGTSSLYGTAYRHRGFGGRQEVIIVDNAYPGKLKQWTAQG